ncbi:MAG: type 4a pilus biogenesis protein PilO, partial [Myxococcota bacterium]
ERLIQQRGGLSQEKDKQVQYVQRIGQYEARFNQLQQDLNEARSQLPDEADVPQLLAQLDNAARQSGLSIENFAPTGENPKQFYSEVGVNMEVKGSYHEIATFVDAVGKMDRIVNVQDIQMTGPKVVNKKVVLQSKFAIKTYRFINSSSEKKDAKKK